MFKIITPVYNAEMWIEKCIASVKNQKFKDFQQIIVDDCSTDSTLKKVKNMVRNDSRFFVFSKPLREGSTHSHMVGHYFFSKSSKLDDIFVHLDGDDWLAHSCVLGKLNNIYQNSDIWATYGNYETTDGSKSVCRISNNSVREEIKAGWPFSHIRTFRSFLWKKLRYSDFLDSNGNIFTSACDVVIFSPILEMCGSRVKFINEILYVYNRDNPLNDDKDRLLDQIRCALEVANKSPKQIL